MVILQSSQFEMNGILKYSHSVFAGHVGDGV